MKKSIYLILIFLCVCSIQSQTYTNPESVVFDSNSQKYIISFAGSKTLGMQADSTEPLVLFADGLTSPKGMVIYDTVLYVADVTNVKSYSLISRKKLAEYNVPGASFLNDIAVDDLGVLYVSDMNTGKIIRIDPAGPTIETLISTQYQSPNGLYWDTFEQLLYVVYFSAAKSPIQSVDVDTKETKDVFKAEFTMLDGITLDYDGNVYVSSWATDSVYKFDGGFGGSPVALPRKFTSPADIYYDEFNNLLVVPCMNINKVIYQDVDTGNEEFQIKLVSPADGEKNVEPKARFEWEPVQGIDMYYITIYSVNGYALNDSTDKTTYTAPEELPNPEDFYWSIMGFKGEEIFSSDLWGFSTSGIIDKVDINNHLTDMLCPNPAGDYISLVTGKNHDTGYIEIYNSIGTCVAKLPVNGETSRLIDISGIPRGIYFVKYSGKTLMFVKE